MIVMRIIVPRYRTSILERKSGRCDVSSHQDRHSVSFLFIAKFTISFASVDIYFVLRITGC